MSCSSYDGRIQCDARQLPIADETVQCVVTSPPYWGLRDYSACGCVPHRVQHDSSTLAGSQAGTPSERGKPDPECVRCEGTGHDRTLQASQIGLESTPEAYVASLVTVFREVWRVLKQDGCVWLNLGDSYFGSWGNYSGQNRGNGSQREIVNGSQVPNPAYDGLGEFRPPTAGKHSSLKPKDLVGIPWRVAFALQADGWWLRSDVIWSKPNPMPESVTDRPTRAHEYLFLLSKSERYFYDHEAIKEPSAYGVPNSPEKIKSPHGQNLNRMTRDNFRREGSKRGEALSPNQNVGTHREERPDSEYDIASRNKRSVWHIATRPYPEAHYATFPEAIPEICIKAGSRPGDFVLDPFAGSNTTGRVAERLSRRWIACDLGYQDLQGKRLTNVQRELVEAPQ